MPAFVELINNPYTQKLRVLINGEAVSEYSNLKKYMDEPFCYWCDRILDGIFEECNRGDFSLHFSSRKEELAIMQVFANSYPHCVQYSSSLNVRSDTLQHRMTQLNQLIRMSNEHPRVSSKRVLFVLPQSFRHLEKDLRDMEVRNSFCQIDSSIAYYHEFPIGKQNVDTIILLSDEKAIPEYMSRLSINTGFGIQVNHTGVASFLGKNADMFIYQTTNDLLFQTIFECLMLIPLLDIFRSCIATLSSDFARDNKESIAELQSVTANVVPVPENQVIEKGRSVRIQFQSDITGYEINLSQLRFSYKKNGLIRCNGFFVEGLQEGSSTLYVYKEGENDPCASVDFKVIVRNRIQKLQLEESRIYIGEGDQARLNYTYLPVNADNASLIEWHSDNADVATIDSYGNLHGIKRGSCTIRCIAEQVSASCNCIVKPHLKHITVDATELEMIYGEEKSIQVKLSPEDCIDDEIVISSMDMRTVNVVGQTIKAVGLGVTRVVVQNKQETVRAEIRVSVMTEKEFRQRQRQRDKQDGGKKEKKSWFSRLFG